MELSWQLKEAVWQRQNGMCGISGKKFDELIHGEVEYHFRLITPPEDGGAVDVENCVMLWNQYRNFLESRDDSIKLTLKHYHFPYANFQEYSYEKMYNDISTDVEYCVDTVKALEDVNAALNFVKETVQNIKSLKLEKEHREELLVKLHGVGEELTAKKDSMKEQEDHEYQANYEKLKALVEEALRFSEENADIKASRDKLINVQNEIKNYNLKKNHREELFTALNNTFEELNKKQSEERESYEMECIENYHNIKNKVDEAVKYLNTASDLQDARKVLIDTQGQFKGLKLKKEQREEQYTRIQDAFDLLSMKIDEEKKLYEEECAINNERMKTVVFEAVKFAATCEMFKDGRERLIDAQTQIKNVRLKKEQKEDFFNIIRTAFDDLNDRQDSHREEFEKETQESHEYLKPLVDEAIEFSKVATFFKEAREKLTNIQEQIKEKRLKRDQREEMYDAIRVAFDELNKRQEIERGQFDKDCEDNYKLMKDNVEKAVAFANSTEEFSQARQNLISVQQTIKAMKLKKEQRDELYQIVRDCFNNLNDRSEKEKEQFEQESVDNFAALRVKVDKAVEDAKNLESFRQIREMLISVQNDIKILKLKRKDREELQAKMREAFTVFDSRQQEYYHEQKQQREEKLVLILSNLKEKKLRIEESIVRDQELLAVQQDKLKSYSEDPASTRLVIDTEKRIAAIEARIHEKEESRDKVSERISDINKELNIH